MPNRLGQLALIGTVVFLGGTAARAQESLEHVVVLNRTHPVSHRLELSLDASTLLVTQLLDTYDFTAGLAYNLDEVWAVELRAGYAVSGHSGLADTIAQQLIQQSPTGATPQLVTADDLSGLWELKAHGLAGVRWAPVYGKLSLLAEAPVHFQSYLWAGGGVAMLHRQSVVYCHQVADPTAGTCAGWLTADRWAPVASLALGMRFFSGPRGALRLEVRDIAFRDSYLVNIDRAVAEAGGSTGTASSSPGIENLVMLELGFSFFL